MQYTPFFTGNPYLSISETGVAGCYLVERTVRRDGSGTAFDLYDASALREVGIDFVIHEVLLSTSAKRSEEHTSELQSRENLVCRLLLEKKKNANFDIVYEHIQIII